MKNIIRLKVKVTPGAKQDSIIGWYDDVLKVWISDQTEKDKANTGLSKLIAEALGVHAKNVRVNMRQALKNKHVSIDGLSEPGVKIEIDHHVTINKKVVN